MDLSSLPVVAGLVAVALFSGLSVLALATAFAGMRRPPAPSILRDDGVASLFLFDGPVLIDATASARRLIAGGLDQPLDTLADRLRPRFGDLKAELTRVAADGIVTLRSVRDDAPELILQAENRSGMTRISLVYPATEVAVTLHDPAAVQAMEEELTDLRRLLAEAPLPIWRETADGVVWANPAYLDALPDAEVSWPLPRLVTGDGRQVAGGAVYAVARAGDAGFALPADAAAAAEERLRSFRHAMARSFAALPTGIAIFDAGRRLQTFNPAIPDITGLGVEFLSQQPNLMAFLDALRDQAMIPEPRDYKAWRRRMAGLERAATAGAFREDWVLPGGRSIRVTGVPHPDGALALMFDDVSQQEDRSLRLRHERDLLAEGVDGLALPVLVVEQGGRVIASSASYREIWDQGFAAFGSPMDVRGHLRAWAAAALPSAIWPRLEAAVFRAGAASAAFSGEVRLRDGRLLALSCRPAAGGVVLQFDMAPQAGRVDLAIVEPVIQSA
jgi:PAS domain-containing protein